MQNKYLVDIDILKMYYRMPADSNRHLKNTYFFLFFMSVIITIFKD